MQVFDLGITLNEAVSQRDRDRGVPDVHVRLKMGQIRLVFLMKYIKVRFSIVLWDRDWDPGIPDAHVRLKMGQIRLVFLMKYIKVRLSVLRDRDRDRGFPDAKVAVLRTRIRNAAWICNAVWIRIILGSWIRIRINVMRIRLVFLMKHIKVRFSFLSGIGTVVSLTCTCGLRWVRSVSSSS